MDVPISADLERVTPASKCTRRAWHVSSRANPFGAQDEPSFHCSSAQRRRRRRRPKQETATSMRSSEHSSGKSQVGIGRLPNEWIRLHSTHRNSRSSCCWSLVGCWRRFGSSGCHWQKKTAERQPLRKRMGMRAQDRRPQKKRRQVPKSRNDRGHLVGVAGSVPREAPDPGRRSQIPMPAWAANQTGQLSGASPRPSHCFVLPIAAP